MDFAGSVIHVRASYHEGVLSTPKSGKVRSVPMAPDVASAMARLGDRPRWTADEDFGFVGEQGLYLDGSALRRLSRITALSSIRHLGVYRGQRISAPPER